MLPVCGEDEFLSSVGWFSVSAPRFTSWLQQALEKGVSVRSMRDALDTTQPDSSDVSRLLRATPPRQTQYAVLASEAPGWCALLTSGPLGTDVGVLPIHAVEELTCTAIRAVCVPDGSKRQYPARILELWSHESTDALRYLRAVAATYDGYRWAFNQGGLPLSFEDQTRYERRLKRQRVTPEMIRSYLLALNAPCDVDIDFDRSSLVTRTY